MSQSVVVPAPCVTWRILPLRTPHIVRACPRCGGARSFASSDRFRVNASGRKLDVWLIYRCVVCDFTWNLTVVERATPETIGAAQLAAYHRDDADLAWSCAFDAALLRRAGARLDPATPVRVERGALRGELARHEGDSQASCRPPQPSRPGRRKVTELRLLGSRRRHPSLRSNLPLAEGSSRSPARRVSCARRYLQ
jgi:hypothetical protein